jgi:hypothetical protein
MLKFDQEVKTGDGKFLKLNDKESIVGVLRGDVRTEYVLWEHKKPIPVDPGTAGAKFRFRVNMVLVDKSGAITPESDVKILEMGPSVYKQLKALDEAEYVLAETYIKISRNGTGLDTEYQVIPSPKKPSAAALSALAQIQLHPLEDQTANGQAGTDSTDESLPF